MESLGIHQFGAFLLACVALSLTPGLDTFYILTRSGREGRTVGVAAVLGVNAGCIVHTLAATLGISAILMTSALAFSVLKYAGAAYLVWIGVRMLLSRSEGPREAVTRGSGFSAAFRQGMLTNVLNPKVALFFLAFLPQFVSPHAAHPQLGLLVLGVAFIGVGMTWSMVLAMLGGHMHRWMHGRPKASRWMDRVCGGVLLGFGVKLATQRI
ncbi:MULTISPECIES: LysE family translocator [Dyella]|uniref:LysE family translocator n=2 Tax=Dyella TaxID=231454 RepID=A0A4R0YQJ0_9GAMM|nr:MULTISPECIES: LysE family translocator [Dyella]TBR36563.1 LysE family translocator [Dyella terrae]TCI08345.1 LysE family translocator [Dyella soli]